MPGFAKIVDTIDLSHLLFPDLKEHSLSTLAERLRIDDKKIQQLFSIYANEQEANPEEKAQAKQSRKFVSKRHQALFDAFLLYSVVSKAANHISFDIQSQWFLSLLPDHYFLKQFLQRYFFPAGFLELQGQKDQSGNSEKKTSREKLEIFLKQEIPKNGFDTIRTQAQKQELLEYPSIPDVLKKKHGQDFWCEILPDDAIEAINWQNKEKPDPNKKGRPAQQYRIIEAVCRIFQSGQICMIEAGTGTGKTLGYLVPLIRFLQLVPKEKVIISTHTKALQKQVAEEIDSIKSKVQTAAKPPDASFLDPPVNFLKELNYVIIKGKRNYVCMRRLLNRLFDSNGEIRPAKTVAEARARVYYVMLLSRYLQLRPEIADDLEEVPAHINTTFNPSGNLEEQIKYHNLESDPQLSGKMSPKF